MCSEALAWHIASIIITRHCGMQHQQTPASLLVQAASAGDLERIRSALRLGANVVNAHDPDGKTALHAASWSGHQHVVKFLIEEAGACVNEVGGPFRWSALHFAATKGHLAIVRYLVSKGGDMMLKDSRGNTPQFITLVAVSASSSL